MKVYQLKNTLQFVISMLLLYSFSACSHSETPNIEKVTLSESTMHETNNLAPEEAIRKVTSEDNIPNNSVIDQLKIIKSAQVKYKVSDVKKATRLIKRLAHNHNAYIANLNFENNTYEKENKFTIKVPKQHFELLMDSIVTYAEFIDYENITSKDVTEEYIDAQTRLETKIVIKNRYEDILRKKSKTVEDLLNVEEKLRVIQEEIEATKGKLNYLNNRVSFSTIQISLYETVDYKEKPVVYKQTFTTKLKNSFSFGLNFLEKLLLGIIHIWPIIVLGIVGYFAYRKRKNSSKKES